MVESLSQFYYSIDGFLILFYRFSSIPIVNYMIGTFCLSMIAVVLGELTVSIALKLNKKYIGQLSEKMNQKESMSIAAYERGDMDGYKALNKQASDAWGKKFFTMMGHSAAILWPIPFALGWMQTRFQEVEFMISFPFSVVMDSVSYTFSFFPIYILSRIVFAHMRPWLPYFSSVHKSLMETASDSKAS